MIHRRKRPLSLAAVAVLALAVLLGCEAAGAGDPDDLNGTPPGEDGIEFLMLPSDAIYGIIGSPDDGGPEGANDAAADLAANGFVGVLSAQLYVTLAYASWDPTLPSTYESGGVTFTWEKVGNTYTWTYSFDDGLELSEIVIVVTDNDTTRDVTVTIDSVELLSGTVATDGSSGEARWYGGDLPPGESIGVVWGAALPPYDLVFTVSRYDATETVIEGLVVNTTMDGAAGEWAYYDASPFVTPVAGNSWQVEE